MRFKVIGTITNIQVIAKGTGVDIRQHLNRTYEEIGMSYVRCVQNKAYIQFGDEPLRDEPLASQTVGYIYKALPPTADEQRLGEVRVIDNEGEDYLYPVDYFEPVAQNESQEISETATVHLDPVTKGILRAEAIAAKKSVSALLRTWIDERLDLPTP